MKISYLIPAIGVAVSPLFLQAQSLDVMYIERSEAVFQTGATTYAPITQHLDDWADFSAFAGAMVSSGTISNFWLTTPGGDPISLTLWADGEYDVEIPFATRQQMIASVPSGTYTFSGTGSTAGNFTETVQVGAYTPVAPKLITNYTQLQSFDPTQPVTISWEPFSDLNGKDGFIEVSIGYWDGFNYNDIWASLPAEGSFGLDPSTTSVVVPAGVITGSPFNYYDVGIFFVRIESMDTPSTPAFAEGIKAVISSLDVRSSIQADLSNVESRIFLQPGNWQYDPRIGWTYGYDQDWGYSYYFGFINVAFTPGWIYQTTLGWLTPVAGDTETNMWMYGASVGWIYTIGGGWYSNPAGQYNNMIAPVN